MERRCRVHVGTHDPATIVDVEGGRDRGPGDVDCGDLAVSGAQEGVGGAVAIDVLAHDLTACVDAERAGLHGARDVDLPEATPVAHETVLEELGGLVALVGVGPDHLSARVDAPDDRSLGAREVDLAEAAPAPDKAVNLPPVVAVATHQLAAGVAACGKRVRRPWRVDRGEAASVAQEAMPAVGAGAGVAKNPAGRSGAGVTEQAAGAVEAQSVERRRRLRCRGSGGRRSGRGHHGEHREGDRREPPSANRGAFEDRHPAPPCGGQVVPSVVPAAAITIWPRSLTPSAAVSQRSGASIRVRRPRSSWKLRSFGLASR